MKLKKRLKLSAMTVFFAMLLGVAVMSIGTEQAFAMEWNETDNRYEISNYNDLKEFANIVNGTNGVTQNTAACAILTTDIVCTDETWTPIGTEANPYTGTFDGCGHVIKKLSNEGCTAAKYQGLFGNIGSAGKVQNVGLENVYIQGANRIGGVAGRNYGTISNCYSTGAVSGTEDVGGVAGINGKGGTISNCFNTGAVSGTQDVGGVVGIDYGGTIEGCHNTGAVSGSVAVGGVVGDSNSTGTIGSCYNTGDVSGSDGVGGMVGFNNAGVISNCYNTGDVSGTQIVGGVVGGNSGIISNNYNAGTVSGSDYTGGVAGGNDGTIRNNYSAGTVSGTGSAVGGVAGINGNAEYYVEGTIIYCYYDKNVCKLAKAIGEQSYATVTNVTGLTTDQMTGTGALDNMWFAYGTGETSPWMERANDANTLYYPHLKGFRYDTTDDPADWPPTIHIHTWDAGKVTKKATEKATGVKTYTCTGCKATRTETIPKLKPTVSGTSMAKVKAGKKSLTISWTKVKGAAGYDIFFAKCNHDKKEVKCKKVKTIKAGKTFKWTKTGLKKGTAYKAYVKAFVYKNGKKSYVRTSPTVHAYTGNGNKTESNAKSVKVNKTKVVLKKGKTFKVKAKVIKVSKKKKLISKKHAPTLRYLSTNKKVATVSKSGKITAKGKGTCTVIAFAHNGVSKSIKVTVP